MRPIRLLIFVVLSTWFVSCTTQKKMPFYLENVSDTTGQQDVIFRDLHIQKNDLLSIQVYSSSTKPELSDALYNLPCGSAGGTTNTCGFLVDAEGNIEYPRLGTIHVEGMTKQELATEVKRRLTTPVELLNNPGVIIRFLNYKITILGQVGHEGVLTVNGERVTILEAIGLAGGITDYGKKNNVKIFRENNGKREVGIVDLSSAKLFESPYFNLMQNDVVIVEPTKQKAKQMEQSMVAQRITFALSLITSAAFIYNIFK
jgi:polysaccharide export outer membrane protein